MGFCRSRVTQSARNRLLIAWFPTLIVLLGFAMAAGAQGVSGDVLGLAGFSPSLIEVERERRPDRSREKRFRLDGRRAGCRPGRPEARSTELIGRLANLTVADVLQGEPEQFGLHAPQANVRLVDGTGETKELLIGDLRSPVSLFVAPAGSPTVYAVSNVSLARIGQNPAAFLDTLLLAIDPAEVVGYEYRSCPLSSRAPTARAEEVDMRRLSIRSLCGDAQRWGLADGRRKRCV